MYQMNFLKLILKRQICLQYRKQREAIVLWLQKRIQNGEVVTSIIVCTIYWMEYNEASHCIEQKNVGAHEKIK